MISRIACIIAGITLGATATGLTSTPPQTQHTVQVIERPTRPTWEDMQKIETPAIDSLMDDGWLEESDRQADCLFQYLQDHVGHEITLERVLAAGAWTDTLGGACAVLEGDLRP